jgi:hypothetical protein
MTWLRFLSKLAFFCNVFFLLTILLRYWTYASDFALVSTIVIIGYFLALIFSPLVNLSYLILLIRRKKITAVVPQWLVIANFIFLLLQLQYILFLNDTSLPK